jgi:hypothetical protein
VCDRIELHDLPENIQAEMLEHAAETGGKIETFMRWINAGVAVRLDEEVAGE